MLGTENLRQILEILEKVPVVDDALSSHKKEIFLTTSLDKVRTESELQRDWNYNVELSQPFVAKKLNLVQGRG